MTAASASAPSKKEKEKEEVKLSQGLFGLKIDLPHRKPVQHRSAYLPDGHLCFNIIGESGCGKSHVLLSIIPQIANLGQCIICTLVPGNPVYDQIEKYCEKEGIEYADCYDAATAQDTITTMIDERDPTKEGLVVFDDFSNQKSGRNDPYNCIAAIVSAQLRNYGYHSIYITQSATNIPTLFRNNCNVRIVFQMNDQHAIKSIRGDLVNSGLITKEGFEELYRLVMNEHHAFLMVVTKGGSKKLYIYLPSEGEVEEVEIKDAAIPPDESLAELIERDKRLGQLVKLYNETNDSKLMGRAKREKILGEIEKYAAMLSSHFGFPLRIVIDAINVTYELNLRG